MVEIMGLFGKDKNYNLELKNAVEEWINANEFKRGTKVNKIKKYAKNKLKNETGFSEGQQKILKDVTSTLRGNKIKNYDYDTLRLMHLSADDYRDKTIERLITEGVPVIFPQVNTQITSEVGAGAVTGGLLFGVLGAVVGGAIGASNQQITEKMVRGELGTLKVADKGIVLSDTAETSRIEWEQIKQMEGKVIELVDGKHIVFCKLHNNEIIEPIINHRAQPTTENGW
jgi:hypothetical protein